MFGNYRGGIGSVGIVTSGQYDAKINATPSGIRAIPMYRTSVEFLYRKQELFLSEHPVKFRFSKQKRSKVTEKSVTCCCKVKMPVMSVWPKPTAVICRRSRT